MYGRQAPTTLSSKKTRAPIAPPPGVYEPNFGLLASDQSWRNSWMSIVAGRFSSSAYSGLLFIEQFTGYAELYDTDGEGRIQAPFRRSYSPLGDRATWTHVTPGFFGPSGFTGLLLYDQAAGFGRFYDADGQGGFTLRSEYSGWRTSWTHIVSGRFVATSPYSSVFFYSASENYGEIWETDGKGLVGTAPYQTFPSFWNSAFTHVLAADFHWTPFYITTTPTLTDLFFYNAASGHGEMYRCDVQTPGDPNSPSNIVLAVCASSDNLPRGATSVGTGNFGGLGNSDLAFYGPGGTLTFYAFEDIDNAIASLLLRETQSGLRTTANLVVSGNFWMSNPEDHWFNDGPPAGSTPPYDPDWRFGDGAFADLLLYDRSAGLGEFYFHEAPPPPGEPIEGYITSASSHNGAAPIATGSVLPGESIAFHVSSQAGPYSITIYQQGWFGADKTEQQMAVIDGLPTNPTPFSIGRTGYRDGAQWPAVATFVVPRWPSGLYLARVQITGAPENTVDIPFVVRAPSGAQSEILLVLSDTTYCAYDDWGMRNSYGNLSAADFAGAFPSTSAFRIPFGFQLSFERPFYGGFGNLPQAWEIPFIEWLARRGIPIDVCTSRDLHFDASSLIQHRLVLFVGHHEYWSAEMRTHTETFAKSGGNVAFFSGNNCWWQIRLSADGRQSICYKVAGFDPVSTTADHALTTVHWFDDLVKRPETALTGASWQNGGLFYDSDHRFTVKQPDHWVFAGTGLTNGATFGDYEIDGTQLSVAGVETDVVQANGTNGLTSPPNYTLASVYDLASPTYEVGTMGIFTPASGAGMVFSASTNNWASGLNHDENSWNLIDRITLNIISKLGQPPPSPWTSVSQGQSKPGARVTAVLTGPNQIVLFLADPAGGIYTASGNANGWSEWTSVSQGQSTPGAPITAVVTGPTQITLFLADPAGGIYTVSGNAAQGWSEWTSVSEGQSTPGGSVTALLTGPNQIALFLADPGGGVYTASGNATQGWSEWTSVSQGQTTPGAPVTAVLIGQNQIALFLADPEGEIYMASGSANNGWSEWTSVSQGQTTPGAPVTAVLIGQNQIALFLADPEGGIYAVSGNANTGWSEWTSVSAGQSIPGAPIAAVQTGSNRIEIFMANSDGSIYTTSGNVNDGWQVWTSVSEGQTTPGAPVTVILTGQKQVALFLADPKGGIYTATTVQLS
jgi:hypothetical protein